MVTRKVHNYFFERKGIYIFVLLLKTLTVGPVLSSPSRPPLRLESIPQLQQGGVQSCDQLLLFCTAKDVLVLDRVVPYHVLFQLGALHDVLLAIFAHQTQLTIAIVSKVIFDFSDCSAP